MSEGRSGIRDRTQVRFNVHFEQDTTQRGSGDQLQLGTYGYVDYDNGRTNILHETECVVGVTRYFIHLGGH